jgi:predicted metal-dependent phosphoesterase TrpH
MDIKFSKPFPKEGCMNIDMHYHTNHSDGAAKVDEVLKVAAEGGFGVAISDHNEVSGSLEAFSKGSKVTIIPAIEVKSKELVDVLFYFFTPEDMKEFFTKEIEKKKKKFFHASLTSIPLDKVFHLSKKYRCRIAVPHMYGYSTRIGRGDIYEKHKEILDKVAIFEAINGGNNRQNNQNAVDFIQEHGKCFIGGSDGHSIFTLGNVLTSAKAKDIASFFSMIEKKKNSVEGIEVSMGKLGEYSKFGLNKIKNIFSDGNKG